MNVYEAMDLHDSMACSVWGIPHTNRWKQLRRHVRGSNVWATELGDGLLVHLHSYLLAGEIIRLLLVSYSSCCKLQNLLYNVIYTSRAFFLTWQPAPLSVGGMMICGGQSFDCVSSVHNRHIHWFEWGGLAIGLWARHADDHPARAGVGSSSLQLYLTKQIDLHMTIFHTLSIVLQSLFEWSSL
jgi:hypothetical protein